VKRRQGLIMGGLGAGAAAAGVWWASRAPSPESSDDTPVEAGIWGTEMATPNGSTLRLADFRGRWLLVNFWATWCPPCVREMPLLEAFYKANAGKSWQVVGIAADQAEAVKSFLTRQAVSYPLALAGFAGIELSRQLGNLAGGLPFTVLFAPDGQVMQRHTGELKEDVLSAWAQLKLPRS
jgi:thiol-disulfide isomerase/thioredoxin